jgi:hypothetical protein
VELHLPRRHPAVLPPSRPLPPVFRQPWTPHPRPRPRTRGLQGKLEVVTHGPPPIRHPTTPTPRRDKI